MRGEVIETFGVSPERTVVIPNGVDTDLFHPDDVIRRAAKDLLFVGRLSPEKNPLLAIDMMAALPDDVTLHIVGAGELEEEIRRRVAALGLRNVRLEGRRSHAELAANYRRATAVVMTSVSEGVPLALLEAMATGTPVICTGLRSLVETGGDAVIPVRPATAAGLAAAARGLMSDPLLQRRLSVAGRRRAARYTWVAVAAAVEDLYLRVRAERR